MSTDTLQPEQLTPPMILDGDSPRVHRHDPITSHLAADKSQKHMLSVRERVLQLLADRGPMAAFELCDAYASQGKRCGWPHVHHESPRKRMSDMKRDGILFDTGDLRMNREGSWEAVVAIAPVPRLDAVTPGQARSTFRYPENADLARPAIAAVDALAQVDDETLEVCS
jgi:hypothetical protein